MSQEAPFPTLAELERAHLRLAYDRFQGNMSAMARALGVDRTTIYRKLRRMGFQFVPMATVRHPGRFVPEGAH